MHYRKNLQAVDLQHAYRFLGYGPLVLVSTTDGLQPDVSAVAWSAPCAKTPPTLMIAIGKSHKTYKNIMKTGTFGINIPTPEQLDLVMYTGTVSGHKVDKVTEGRIGIFRGGELAQLPLVKGCAAWLECRMIPGIEAGDHSIIVAQAVAAWCRPGVLTDDNTWNVADFPTVHHLGGRKFLVGEKVITAAPGNQSLENLTRDATEY